MKSRLIITIIIFATLLLGTGTALASSPSQTGNCTFTTSLDFVPVYAAPLTDGNQLVDYIPNGATYPVLAQNGMHFMLTLDGLEVWVDRRSGSLAGNCDSVPVDTRTLSDFPTICILTTSSEMLVFAELELLTPMGTLSPGTEIPVSQEYAGRYYVLLDSARGAWTDGVGGDFSGRCTDLMPGLPTNAAITTSETRIWTEPNVAIGQVVTTLDSGVAVNIVSPPVPGQILYDSDVIGIWYRISVGDGSSGPVGWVWSARLLTMATPQTPVRTGITLDNARLWSAPDVRQGGVILDVTPGTVVTIIAGPVSGPIRYDNFTTGNWYQIHTDGFTGWIWEGRLVLD